jgi:hypothetical protein
MSERYCPKCAAEVEDLGGYCALGHSLMLRPLSEITDLGDLKAEVNKAFAEAESQVASVLASVQAVTGELPAVPPPPPQASTQAAPPAPPPARYADEFDEYDEEARVRSQTFWQALDDEDPEPSRTDPITAFAPSPRMDWGPNKAPGKKSRRKP